MPTLNKEPVNVGDRIYDITQGVGSVTHLSEKTIEVSFATGRRISYNQHGQLNGIRRLYWHHPIFLDPPKSKTKWEKTLEALSTIYKLINDYR